MGVLRRLGLSLTIFAAAILLLTGQASAATDTVTNLNASGAGSLPAVVAAAASGDTIVFQAGLSGTIDLTGTIDVTQNLTIQGPGAGTIAISGQNSVGIFDDQAEELSISGLTLEDGSSFQGGAISEQSSSIALQSLTVSNMMFSDNVVNNPGGYSSGGAIAVMSLGPGSLTVSDSTFAGNSGGSTAGVGGAIFFGPNILVPGPSSLSVTGSTFVDNTVGGPGGSAAYSGYGQGGALYLVGGSATVVDSTFVGNSAGGTPGTGYIAGDGYGGAIDDNGFPLTLTSDTIDGNFASTQGSAIDGASVVTADGTLVADDTGQPACNAPVSSSSFSLEGPAGSTSCGFDLTSAEPGLLSLADNGGPTQTQALPVGSPAVDVVPAADCPAADAGVDQRGEPRPSPGSSFCDVGAFELQDTTSTSVSCAGSPFAYASSTGCDASVTATDAPEAGTPQGSVSYQAYSDSACSVAVGSAQVVALAADGSVPAFDPGGLSPGSYYVQAAYSPSGSVGNFSLQGSVSGCVAFAVAAPSVAATSISTSLSGGGQSGAQIVVAPGSGVSDQASLSGANVSIAGGSVTYSVYSDPACSVPVAASQTVAVSDGSAPASSPVVLPEGTYFWQASYSGDASNQASTGTCGVETEVVLSSARHGADVGVGLVVQPASPEQAGGEFVVCVTVTDYGPKPASNVVAGLLLPHGLSVDNAGGASQFGGLLVWHGGTFSVGETTTYHVWVTPTRAGAGNLIAGAFSLGTLDPDYHNNIAEQALTVNADKRLQARRVKDASGIVLARLRAGRRRLEKHAA